ncbi:MAG: transglutaminase family protein [Acidobacteriia bacterium]|nr:transglutaminase family protein [Terriglobia bacterium]
MRISVVHSTTYRYDRPVFQEPHTFRLRPRQDAAQHLRRYALEISPAPAGKTECLDQDGNVVLEAWFDSLLEEMAVRSSFEIDTLRDNPFDFVLAGKELAGLPLTYGQPLAWALAPYLGAGNECQAVRELARSVAESAGWATLAFLTELNRVLFETFEHIIRDHGPPLDAEVTLQERAGSCRDLAVLYCAACRTMGIPARFVSGYEREAAFQDQANMHAWAEVYLAGGGWRGYDPTGGLAVATSHVAVAAAADPRLAAPISGSYRGSASAKMEFAIGMQVEAGGEDAQT